MVVVMSEISVATAKLAGIRQAVNNMTTYDKNRDGVRFGETNYAPRLVGHYFLRPLDLLISSESCYRISTKTSSRLTFHRVLRWLLRRRKAHR